jgi:hypothetical protein
MVQAVGGAIRTKGGKQMSGFKILLLLGAIAFLIGALLPVVVVGSTPRMINWLCLGLAFVTFAYFIKAA